MPVLCLPDSDNTSVRAKALVFEDEKSRALLARIQQVAPSDATVLLCGETGTGKEIVARHVHELSPRREQAFVGVNCGALPESLVESELFGHERGAFTGAVSAKAGWFESAHGGTLFLDEIGDLPLSTQVKLLRVLQEGEVVRLGARAAIPIDVRLIAATNVDLLGAVRSGRFREDLYYRLHVAPLTIAPLRERPADILPIARHFLSLYARRLRLEHTPELDAGAEAALRAHAWPGNIRELENAVHHALLVGRGSKLTAADLRLPRETIAELRAQPGAEAQVPHPPTPAPAGDDALEAAFARLFDAEPAGLFDHIVERLVRAAYERCEHNQVHTARLLGISRNVLRARLAHIGELPPRRSEPSCAPPPTLARAPSHPRPSRLVRIGYQRFGLLPLVKASRALERAFAADGVGIEWREFTGGMALLDAFEREDLHLGLVGEVPPIFAQAARIPMVYLAAEAQAPEHEAIVVAADSAIDSVEALRGRTVMLCRGSSVHYFLILALEAARLSYADIHVVYAAPEHAQALFTSGQVDAWATWEPFLSRVQREAGARVVRSARGLTTNTSYYVGASSFVQREPKLVASFLEQLQAVGYWAETERSHAASLLASALEVPLTAAGQSFASVRAPEPFDRVHLAAQQNLADTFRRLGLVDAPVDVTRACWPLTGPLRALLPPRERPA